MTKPNTRAGIELMERDYCILRDFYVSRIMTLAHVAALHFEGRKDAAKKRLQKLKGAALIRERPRKARDPGILFLAKRGYDTVKAHGSLAELPALSWAAFERRANVSPLTLRHELEVMNVKAAMTRAIELDERLSVIEFTTWPLLCEFTVRTPERSGLKPEQVRPDGMLRVLEKTSGGGEYEHAFFLEVDRGPETLDRLAVRIAQYREHYAGGGYARSMGADRTAIEDYPFRVLMVFPSEERRNNIAERFLQIRPAIESLAWLATASDVARDSLGQIWMRPRDYREATRDTPYQVNVNSSVGNASMRRSAVYRRRVDREAHVRAVVVRQPLFENEPAMAQSSS